MATTHGRAYEKHLLYPITEPVSHLTWLITGISDEIEKRISTGIIVTLCSSYPPPDSTSQIASEFPLKTSSRMGYFTDRTGAPCVCFRTKKYSLSSLIEYRHGTYGQQTHPGQLLINNNIPVFVTAFENASKTHALLIGTVSIVCRKPYVHQTLWHIFII